MRLDDIAAECYKTSSHSVTRGNQGPGDPPRHFLYLGEVRMRELSVFVDESGNSGEDAKYYC